MPLVEPSVRREKIVVCGQAGVGKSTCALSIAYWAHLSGDKRRFWYLDFDDSAGDLLLDKKYSDMTNIEILTPPYDWDAWLAAAKKVIENAQSGDFIVGDMIDRGWPLAQEWESTTLRGKDRTDEQIAAAKEGRTGWELFRDTNWTIVNGQWNNLIKPMMLQSPAHILLTTEVKDLGGEARGNEPQNVKDARVEFGRYLPAGQKSLPYQARSVLRIHRLARGRVLSTLKDRARREMKADECPDFMTSYMRDVAGWAITDSE